MPKYSGQSVHKKRPRKGALFNFWVDCITVGLFLVTVALVFGGIVLAILQVDRQAARPETVQYDQPSQVDNELPRDRRNE